MKPFWRKGNWVLIAIYALINVLFSNFLRRIARRLSEEDRCILFHGPGDDLYQCGDLFSDHADQPVVPGSVAHGRDDFRTVVAIVIWIFGSRFIYSKLYQARRLLVIYGDRDPGDLIHKMNSRRDKYNISGKVHIDAGEKEIHKMMKEYDGVIHLGSSGQYPQQISEILFRPFHPLLSKSEDLGCDPDVEARGSTCSIRRFW